MNPANWFAVVVHLAIGSLFLLLLETSSPSQGDLLDSYWWPLGWVVLPSITASASVFFPSHVNSWLAGFAAAPLLGAFIFRSAIQGSNGADLWPLGALMVLALGAICIAGAFSGSALAPAVKRSVASVIDAVPVAKGQQWDPASTARTALILGILGLTLMPFIPCVPAYLLGRYSQRRLRAIGKREGYRAAQVGMWLGGAGTTAYVLLVLVFLIQG